MSREMADHNVVAAYRDLELATDAVDDLREAEFGDDQLSVLGEAPEDLDVNIEHESGEPLDGDVFEHIAVGGGAGGALGALLGGGATAAVAALPGVGMVVGTGVLLGAVAGAFAGSTVGSIVEGEAALRSQAGWRQTFESVRTALTEGGVVVGVHVDEPDEAERARELLADTAPISLHRLNRHGEERVR